MGTVDSGAHGGDVTLEQRPLGRSALRVSPIVFGAMALRRGQDPDERVKVIRAAFDAGITAVDTAPLYEFGRSEELVGQAIHGLADRVRVLTKVGLRWDDPHGEILFAGSDPQGRRREVRKNSQPESLRLEVEQSLRRLDVERLDLVQVHHRDRATPIADTMCALLALRQEGKLAEIGVSNYSADEVDEAAAALGDVPLASVQSAYSLVRREVEGGVLKAARDRSVGFLCYSPLEQSLLAGSLLDAGFGSRRRRARSGGLFAPGNAKQVNAVLRNTVAPISRRHDATLAQVALAWLLAQPGVTSVVVGANTLEQVAANARAASVRLTRSELSEIRRAFEAIRLDPNAGPSLARRSIQRLRVRLGALRRRLST